MREACWNAGRPHKPGSPSVRFRLPLPRWTSIDGDARGLYPRDTRFDSGVQLHSEVGQWKSGRLLSGTSQVRPLPSEQHAPGDGSQAGLLSRPPRFNSSRAYAVAGGSGAAFPKRSSRVQLAPIAQRSRWRIQALPSEGGFERSTRSGITKKLGVIVQWKDGGLSIRTSEFDSPWPRRMLA